MILGRDLLTALGLDIRFSENIIIGGDGTYEGCSVPMVHLKNYEFKSLTDKIVKPEETFINMYVDECLEYKRHIPITGSTSIILDAKYEKADIDKVMTEQCQQVTPSE